MTRNRDLTAATDIGLFYNINGPAIVLDIMLAANLDPDRDPHYPDARSYFVWEVGKVPDVVIEVVSPTNGGEMDRKFREYARIGVPFYVV